MSLLGRNTAMLGVFIVLLVVAHASAKTLAEARYTAAGGYSEISASLYPREGHQ